MDLILVMIAVMFLGSIRLTPRPDHLDRQTTATINGFFLLLVMFSHFITYLPSAPPLTRLWMGTKGGLIVTTFLFFSGYGVMTQIMRRGHGYVDSFPRHRLLFVWVKFAAAITVFLVVAWLRHLPLAPMQVGLAYLGLATIGNSGWYIFAILLLYALTYVAFRGFATRRAALLALIGGVAIYVAVAQRYLPEYYYVTIWCYPLGVWFATQRLTIERWVLASWPRYLGTALLSIGGFVGCWLACARTVGGVHGVLYAVASGLFAWLFVLLALRVSLHNPVLAYIGGSAMFSLYILQRLPMALVVQTRLVHWPALAFVFVLLSTLILGWGFDRVIDRTLRRSMRKEVTA